LGRNEAKQDIKDSWDVLEMINIHKIGVSELDLAENVTEAIFK
jgi:hypothetical protein